MAVTLGASFNYVTANLVLHLNAGNTSSYSGSGTTWTDLSTSKVNATLNANVTYTNPYLTFNGANTIVTTSDWPTWNGQAHTMESWVYPTSISQNGFIFEKGSDVNTQYSNFFEGANFVYRTLGQASPYHSLTFVNSGNITVNAWNHIVCTFDGSTKTVYVNAVQKAQATGLTGLIPYPGGYNGSSIGVYGGPTGSRGYYFAGRIAVIRLYSSALNATQVAQNFNADAAGFGLTATSAGITTTTNGVVVNGTVQYNNAADLGPCISVTSFTTSGSYTVPTGATRVMVQLVGGGGGSAGYCESGGGGGFAEGIFNIAAGTVVSVTVGGSGAATTYNNVGGTGGTSSFGSYISASGGTGCNSINNHGGGIGGVGSGGQTNLYGGTGTGHANHAGYAQSGGGGYTYFGGTAGITRHQPSAQNNYSAAPGAGATGNECDDGSQGSAGASGLVIVYAYK